MARKAVIDMGSNSWRLVVYDYERGGVWALTDEIREAVRVSAGMGDEGVLQPEPMERAVHVAAVFASFCRAAGVSDVDAVATSAIRDAKNRDELLDRIREHTDLEVRVISALDEARYGYLAIVNSTTLRDGFGVDLGGGSVQLMRIEDRHLMNAESMPLGAVRVSEQFLPDEKASKKAIRATREHVAEELASSGWWRATGTNTRLAGIGGTIRNLATAAEKSEGVTDVGLQGYRLSREALEELIGELASRPASKRGGVPGIKPDRGDVILGGALVLSTVMEVGGFDTVEVIEAGLREGVFLEDFLAPADPPLLEDVRRDSVVNLSKRFHFMPEHVAHVAKLSREIYTGLAELELLEASDQDRDLLWAACMLHDVGVAIDYDDHHKHSRYLILNAGLAGFDPREIALIALIARYHRKGDPDASDLGPLARKDDERRLALLSAIIRLAEMLERSRDQSVRSVSLHADNGRVTLEAETQGDADVAIWAARREAGLLGRTIERDVELAEAE